MREWPRVAWWPGAAGRPRIAGIGPTAFADQGDEHHRSEVLAAVLVLAGAGDADELLLPALAD